MKIILATCLVALFCAGLSTATADILQYDDDHPFYALNSLQREGIELAVRFTIPQPCSLLSVLICAVDGSYPVEIGVRESHQNGLPGEAIYNWIDTLNFNLQFQEAELPEPLYLPPGDVFIYWKIMIEAHPTAMTDSSGNTGCPDTCRSMRGFEGNNWVSLDDDLMTRARVDYNITGVDDDIGQLPDVVVLGQNYPNPFNASTTINYATPEASNVTLEVYNLLGQKIATLVNGYTKKGQHSINWDAANFSGGIYFYKLTADDKVIIHRRMALIK